MGSFNVACSVSNISISVGTKVVFFPLLPRRFARGNLTHLQNEKYLIYPNAYYQPFSLPIKGVYNDYGSVEEIEEDENTKAIEDFFGMNIQDFVDGIGERYTGSLENEEKEEIYEQLSGMFVHRAIYDELVAFDLKEKHLANHYLTEDIARFYGFEVIPKEEQILIDSYHPILMRKEGLPYDLKIGEYGAVLLHQDHKEYYAFAFDKRYGKEIAGYWEEATGTKLEDHFAKEFQFDQLTHEQYLYAKEKFTELTGAPLGWSENRQNKHSVYSVVQFAKVYEEITGEALDVSIWTELSQYDNEYNDFLVAIRKPQPEKLNYKELLLKTTDETQRKLLENIIKLDEEVQVDNDFGYQVNSLDFIRFFKEMDFFKALYAPLLFQGKLREALKEYQAFYWSMTSCNRFFFPAMNGEQFGNRKASEMLFKKSLELVQQENKEYEEDEDEE